MLSCPEDQMEDVGKMGKLFFLLAIAMKLKEG
jgi:hypothetical protein